MSALALRPVNRNELAPSTLPWITTPNLSSLSSLPVPMKHSRVTLPKVFFGGPDQDPRLLRDLLESRVDAVPEGGAIDWLTYYFRDERLAEALVRAHRRGVSVRLCVDGRPRRTNANDGVFRILSGPDGIGAGLRLVNKRVPVHLHTKLYCFSHPEPVALVGSFNPSGNEPEDPETIADIGDQDRGHNLLVEIDEPLLVRAFVDHVAAMHSRSGLLRAISKRAEASAETGEYRAFLFPRVGRNPLDERLDQLRPGSTLRIAASHFQDVKSAWNLAKLIHRGVSVELLTHHTTRRTPDALVRFMQSQGVKTYRYRHPQELPMHAKFVLAEDGERSWSAFGSYNINDISRWFNHELLMFSTAQGLWGAFDARWKEIVSEPWCKAA